MVPFYPRICPAIIQRAGEFGESTLQESIVERTSARQATSFLDEGISGSSGRLPVAGRVHRGG